VEAQLQTLASVHAPFVRFLPEVTLLRVNASGDSADLVYSIIHDRAHKNVAFMFGEQDRLIPDEDNLTILPGYYGSYPNFFFDVPMESVPDFARNLRDVSGDAGFTAFVEQWGVRRSSVNFWETADWLQEDFAARQPVQAGLLDLNRYKDP
jgi:hypothetical protein